jgi:threonine synthase
LHDPIFALDLGEGRTPCVELPAMGALLGLRQLFGELEFLNPTGSFKDRGTAVMMAVAREHGVKELVEDSSGNAGASVSAYAARAGIKAHIFTPANAPPAKLRQIRAYGAQVHAIDGSRDATAAAAVAYHTRHRLVYASHALSPYFLEGTKTLAYEIARRFDGGLPRHIVFPVGNGGLLLGAWKGFRELRDVGHIADLPRLHAVQARAVMPLVAAHHGEEWTTDPGRGTVAGGIAVAAPARLGQILDALRATHGEAVAVEDGDILRWHGLLAEREGIYAEPTSAAAFAGVEQLVRRGVIEAGDAVLVPITGSGLKDAPPD